MKEFITKGESLFVHIIDLEENYQGYVEFHSIQLMGADYYCYYKNSHLEKVDSDLPSLLDNETDSYVICCDRSVRISVREFLGLRKYLIRAELGAQDVDLARFELHDEIPTDEEKCHSEQMLEGIRLLQKWMNQKCVASPV